MLKAHVSFLCSHQQGLRETVYKPCAPDPVMSALTWHEWTYLPLVGLTTTSSHHKAALRLTKGYVFMELFELRTKTEIFLKEKKSPRPLLPNNRWLWKSAFAEVLTLLNEFGLFTYFPCVRSSTTKFLVPIQFCSRYVFWTQEGVK